MIWPFHRKQQHESFATQASIEHLLQRLDEQDQQLCRIEQTLNRQTNQIEKLIKRIDRATGGRDVA